MKTIKSKISLGLLFLFVVILILSVSGIYFINVIANNSKGTIKDNYASIDYTKNMLVALDEIYESYISSKNEIDNSNAFQLSKKNFEENLEKEINNITEEGESKLVLQLQLLYHNFIDFLETNNSIKSDNNLRNYYIEAREKVLDIYSINMTAINNKTNSLQKSADSVIIYMSVIATLSVLITLSFLFTFPSSISEPIKEFTKRIKSISEGNYEQKIDIKSKDEIGELASAFNIMVERLKFYDAKKIDQLLFEQKRLETVIQNIDDGILFVDETQKIVLLNNKILELAGLKQNDILLHYLPDVASTNDFIKEIYRIMLLKSSQDDSLIKPLRVIQNNKEFFFSIAVEDIITFAKSENKETYIGSLIVLRNVTEYQKKDKAKTNLLATVSHELKTPLSSINLSLKLLNDKRLGELNEEQKELIYSINQQSNRLSSVINELLDFSQIETGNIRLKFSQVKPDIVLDIGITALMLQITQKKIELQTNIEDNLPNIKVDLEKFAFVFINILSNAIRYSKEGDVINIEIKRTNNDVIFSVEDHGPGISKEDIEKLFQRFTQVGDKSKQGWGLGLAISKEFVIAHGGKIWVESILGSGSKFIFTVPALN